MKRERKENNQMSDYSYSLLHGNIRYKYMGESIPGWLNRELTPIVACESDGSEFIVRRLRYYYDSYSECDKEIHEHYMQLIKRPPQSNYIIWPSDIIEMNSEVTQRCNNFLVHNYQIYDTDSKRDGSKYGLVFVKNRYEGLKSLSGIIKEIKEIKDDENGLCYKNKFVIQILKQILERVSDLNREGYIYYDIDFDRFLVDSRGTVYLDFSNLLYYKNEERLLIENRKHLEEPGEFSLDFSEPWLYQQLWEIQKNEVYKSNESKQKKNFPLGDIYSQNYALASLIFYLLYGKHAYDGKLMTLIADDNPMAHYDIAHERIQRPIFIFDENDKSNSIGVRQADTVFINRWENSPLEVRDYLKKCLCQENATRSTNSVFSLSAEKWLEIIQKNFS